MGLGNVPDGRVAFQAVRDQVGDRADQQSVLPGERADVGQAHHRAVVVHELRDRRGRLEAREPAEVDGRFGVTGPPQHAAVTGAQWADVAWPGEVGGPRVVGYGGTYRRGPVLRRDAGGHADAGLDGDREGRPPARRVVTDHGRQVESVRHVVRQRQAYDATRVSDHEGDLLGVDRLGRQHEVALVLPVLVVDEDDGPATRQ